MCLYLGMGEVDLGHPFIKGKIRSRCSLYLWCASASCDKLLLRAMASFFQLSWTDMGGRALHLSEL